jgi:hypothetical protein
MNTNSDMQTRTANRETIGQILAQPGLPECYHQTSQLFPQAVRAAGFLTRVIVFLSKRRTTTMNAQSVRAGGAASNREQESVKRKEKYEQ